MRWFTLLIVLSFTLVFARSFTGAGNDKEKKTPDAKPVLLVVPPGSDKEVKLVDWRFTFGTRSLDKAGPQYLEFREEKSTTYKNGIFTLIPLPTIRKITYDREKKTVEVVAIADDAKDVTLTGSTKFTTSNRITIEAEELLGDLGVATRKFQGGADKGVKSIVFPAPKLPEKAVGVPSVVTADDNVDDKKKTKHTALDVQPLYQVDGGYRVMPYLMFKKTVKIDLNKIASIRFVPPEDKKKGSTDYEVTLKDGAKHTLTLLTSAEIDKKKSMTLVGLVGRVPVGYKLFSLDAIYEYHSEKDEKK